MKSNSLRGLYAVTSETICRSSVHLLTAAEAALAGGAALIQYRDKWNDRPTRESNAVSLQRLCHEQHALLIINDDVDLALAAGAAGVHLGASDVPLAQARQRLGPEAIIGVTCSGSIQRALSAETGGASYVAFGRFFESRTKPDGPPASLELLTQAQSQLRIPICAIGGITPANAAQVITAGTDMVAAVEGIFAAEDIKAAARAYAALFPR